MFIIAGLASKFKPSNPFGSYKFLTVSLAGCSQNPLEISGGFLTNERVWMHHYEPASLPQANQASPLSENGISKRYFPSWEGYETFIWLDRAGRFGGIPAGNGAGGPLPD